MNISHARKILGNKIISPYYSGETDYLDKDKIIKLNYTETVMHLP